MTRRRALPVVERLERSSGAEHSRVGGRWIRMFGLRERARNGAWKRCLELKSGTVTLRVLPLHASAPATSARTPALPGEIPHATFLTTSKHAVKKFNPCHEIIRVAILIPGGSGHSHCFRMSVLTKSSCHLSVSEVAIKLHVRCKSRASSPILKLP